MSGVPVIVDCRLCPSHLRPHTRGPHPASTPIVSHPPPENGLIAMTFRKAAGCENFGKSTPSCRDSVEPSSPGKAQLPQRLLWEPQGSLLFLECVFQGPRATRTVGSPGGTFVQSILPGHLASPAGILDPRQPRAYLCRHPQACSHPGLGHSASAVQP